MTVEVREKVESGVRAKTVPDNLRTAALLIEEFGWSDDELCDDEGRFCAWGAIIAAADGMPERSGYFPNLDGEAAHEALTQLALTLNLTTACVTGSVSIWNDLRESAAEVTAALRAAADAYETGPVRP